MRKITEAELKQILDDHKEWLESDYYGCESVLRANLSFTDLRGANLRDANLACADLTGADLTNADLTNADLTYTHLTGANLTDAKLTGANLHGAISKKSLIERFQSHEITKEAALLEALEYLINKPGDYQKFADAGILDESHVSVLKPLTVT